MPSSGASPSGSRIAMPSSDQIVWTSSPSRSRRRASMRQRPRRVDPAAERGQQAQPPVAQLVAEALDDDPPVGRQDAGRLALLVEVGQQVLGRAARRGRGVSRSRAVAARRPLAPSRQVGLDLAREGAQRPPELDRPADRVALPERQLARLAGRRA